jgi:hypothetical protein
MRLRLPWSRPRLGRGTHCLVGPRSFHCAAADDAPDRAACGPFGHSLELIQNRLAKAESDFLLGGHTKTTPAAFRLFQRIDYRSRRRSSFQINSHLE